MSVIVVSHIVLVHNLDSPQILHVMNSFIAGYDQPKREAVLRTHWLAILAVADQAIVHDLIEWKARRAFHGLRAFCHDVGCAALHAGLLEQEREGHAGPL